MSLLLFDWPYVGVAVAVGAIAVLFLKRYREGYSKRFRDPGWLLWILLPLYPLHQLEEHGINLLGQHYHFLPEMCAVLGFTDLGRCPADPGFIFAVNVATVWIAALAAGLAGPPRAMIGAAAFGLPLVNGIIHIVPAVIKGSYNSGLATAIVLLVPVSGWVLHQLYRQGYLDRGRLAAVIGCGVLMHVVLMGSLQLVIHGLIGHRALDAIQVANGFVPVAIGLAVGTPRPAEASSRQAA